MLAEEHCKSVPDSAGCEIEEHVGPTTRWVASQSNSQLMLVGDVGLTCFLMLLFFVCKIIMLSIL